MKLCLKFQVKILKNVWKNWKKNQSWSFLIKTGPFFDILLHFSIFLLEFFSIASNSVVELCSKFQGKILKNVGKIKERTNFGPILIGSFLLNLCHGYTLVVFSVYIIYISNLVYEKKITRMINCPLIKPKAFYLLKLVILLLYRDDIF